MAQEFAELVFDIASLTVAADLTTLARTLRTHAASGGEATLQIVRIIRFAAATFGSPVLSCTLHSRILLHTAPLSLNPTATFNPTDGRKRLSNLPGATCTNE